MKLQIGNLRTWIEVDRKAILANLTLFRMLAGGADLMAVIKSNAYGHGLAAVSKLIANAKLAEPEKIWFGVDSIVEALRLRREKIKNRILVLGYTLPGRFGEAFEQGISLTISNFESLRALERARRKPKFHIKIESGMYRLGFLIEDIGKLSRILKKRNLRPEGVFSHFAMAQNTSYSERQLSAFEHALGILRESDIVPQAVHIAKTEGILLYPESARSLVRLGIGLYGYCPSPVRELKPALEWKTIVVEKKRVKRGERIGYDLTERCRRDTMLAVLPVGYWHGYDRGLSSRGEVFISGTRAKVLGRICMDMTMVDVTDVPGVRVGSEAVLIGHQGKDFVSADEIGKKIGTTSYEVLTRINPLMRRVFI